MSGIRKEDILDSDIVDASELISDGYSTYATSTLISTNNTGSIVTINLPSNGEGLITGLNNHVEVGDVVWLFNTSIPAVDGYYLVNVVLTETSFSVVGSIASSTGGNVNFMYPAGAGRVGFNNVPVSSYTSSKTVQSAVEDLFNIKAQKSTQIISGAGLTGGGDLSTNRTIDVVANVDGSIVVNANDIQVGVLASDAQHGNLGGGTLHSVVTTSVNGFMSASDKTKLDGIEPLADVTDWTNVAAALGGQAGVNDGYVFKSNGFGSGNMVLNTQNIIHRITVGKGVDVNYTSIKAAVDYTISQGVSNADGYTWLIQVYPGTYYEDPMTIPEGLSLTASTALTHPYVHVVANNPNNNLFTVTGGSISGFKISGVSDITKSLILINDPTKSDSLIFNCYFENCSSAVIAANGAIGAINGGGIIIDKTGMLPILAAYVIDGSELYIKSINVDVLSSVLGSYYPNNPIEIGVKCINDGYVQLASSDFDFGYNNSNQTAVFCDGGSLVSIAATNFSDGYNACYIGASGVNSTIAVAGTTFKNNVLDFKIDSSTGAIYLGSSATDIITKSIVAGGLISGVIQERATKQTNLIGEIFVDFPSDTKLDLLEFVHDQTTTGVSDPVAFSVASGLNFNVAAGGGEITNEVNEDSRYVAWGAITIALPANSTSYVYYSDTANAITSSTSVPGSSHILLAVVITNATDIRFIHTDYKHISHTDQLLDNYLRDVQKFRLGSGLATTIGSTSRKFNIDVGYYYLALLPLSYAGSTDTVFSAFYGADGYTEVTGQTQVDNTNYDVSGTLTVMDDGYYRSDSVYITSDGRVSVIFGQAEYSSQLLAENSHLLTAPSFIQFSGFPVCRLIVLKGGGIVSFKDERILDAGGGSSSSGGVTVHGLLSGLLADDHTQYLLVSGSRSMGGNLNMGGNSIINVNLVDGVDVSAHAARHSPGGIDALSTGTPVAVSVGASPSAGSAASFAISDHQHGIAAGTPVSIIDGANAAGTASTVARSDHQHSHGSLGGGADHAVATTLVNGFMSAADKAIVDSAVTTTTHRTLRDLIHFINEGPADGFPSLSYKELLPAANIFPTSVIWWESSAKLKKIVEKLYTYSGIVPTTIVWNMYDVDGVTILHSISDAIAYSGIFEISRTRTIV